VPAKRLSQDPAGIGEALEALIADLKQSGWTSRQEAAASVARMLAQTLDAGAGLATAGVTKQYREVLAELAPEVTDDGDDGIERLLAELSTPLHDTETR
jgi:hypothetical protein